MIRQYELVEKVRSYDGDVDEQLLDRAYVFSLKAHGNQKRYSGDPYFSHPLEVAGTGRISAPALSPDSRWLAYVSDENGLREVWVESLDPSLSDSPARRRHQHLVVGDLLGDNPSYQTSLERAGIN